MIVARTRGSWRQNVKTPTKTKQLTNIRTHSTRRRSFGLTRATGRSRTRVGERVHGATSMVTGRRLSIQDPQARAVRAPYRRRARARAKAAIYRPHPDRKEATVRRRGMKAGTAAGGGACRIAVTRPSPSANRIRALRPRGGWPSSFMTGHDALAAGGSPRNGHAWYGQAISYAEGPTAGYRSSPSPRRVVGDGDPRPPSVDGRARTVGSVIPGIRPQTSERRDPGHDRLRGRRSDERGDRACTRRGGAGKNVDLTRLIGR